MRIRGWRESTLFLCLKMSSYCLRAANYLRMSIICCIFVVAKRSTLCIFKTLKSPIL